MPILKQHVASHCVVSPVSSRQWYSIVDSWREHSDTVWLPIFHLCLLWTEILIKWQRRQEQFVNKRAVIWNKCYKLTKHCMIMNLKRAFSSKLSIFCSNRLAVMAIRLATCCATGLRLHFLHIQTRVSGNMKCTGTKIKSVYKALPIKCLHTNLLNIC